MIKLMRCLRRMSDISAEEFRRFWNDPEYVGSIAKLSEMSDAISHTRSLTLQIEINRELADLHGTLEPYDGVIEICWENAQSVLAMRDSEAGMQAADDLLAFEDQFVDRTESRYFFTE